MMRITKTVLASIIRESIKNALGDESALESVRETAHEKKARLEGKKQALKELGGKPLKMLIAAQNKLTKELQEQGMHPAKQAFLSGALHQVEVMIKLF